MTLTITKVRFPADVQQTLYYSSSQILLSLSSSFPSPFPVGSCLTSPRCSPPVLLNVRYQYHHCTYSTRPSRPSRHYSLVDDPDVHVTSGVMTPTVTSVRQTTRDLKLHLKEEGRFKTLRIYSRPTEDLHSGPYLRSTMKK